MKTQPTTRTQTSSPLPVTLDDVRAAAGRLSGKIHRTPLLASDTLSQMANTRVFLKAELFQKTGSFKLRGALNRMSQLTPDEKRRGVIATSSGNHAQAVAYSARLLGIKAVVVMPANAVPNKVEATKRYGAEVVLNPDSATLFERAAEIQKERGLIMVHPFDDPAVIAGQGTMGLEILEDRPDVSAIIIPIGGGGSVSGISVAAKALKPDVKIYGVQAEGAATMVRALEAGRPVPVVGKTIADGLMPPHVSANTFAITQRLVDKVITVSDEAIRRAMMLVWERCKLFVEPSGAAPVAGLLSKKLPLKKEGATVCVLTGGNVNLAKLADLARP